MYACVSGTACGRWPDDDTDAAEVASGAPGSRAAREPTPAPPPPPPPLLPPPVLVTLRMPGLRVDTRTRRKPAQRRSGCSRLGSGGQGSGVLVFAGSAATALPRPRGSAGTTKHGARMPVWVPRGNREQAGCGSSTACRWCRARSSTGTSTSLKAAYAGGRPRSSARVLRRAGWPQRTSSAYSLGPPRPADAPGPTRPRLLRSPLLPSLSSSLSPSRPGSWSRPWPGRPWLLPLS